MLDETACVADELPPNIDYLNAPGCEVILQSPADGTISASRLAAILMRLAGQRPDAELEFWLLIKN